MRKSKFGSILAWLVAAFFLVGAIVNATAGEQTAADYARWGYPSWFPYITAVMELIAAGLVAYRPTRRYGAAVGSLVMLGATATLLLHSEYTHALAPLAVLALTVTVVILARKGTSHSDTAAPVGH